MAGFHPGSGTHRAFRPGGDGNNRALTGHFGERLFHFGINRIVVPLVGRIISGDSKAYSYLGASMETFDSRTAFCARAVAQGFELQRAQRLFPGVASMIVLRRV